MVVQAKQAIEQERAAMLQIQGAQEQTFKAEKDDIILQAQLIEDKLRLSEGERA